MFEWTIHSDNNLEYQIISISINGIPKAVIIEDIVEQTEQEQQ